VSCPLCGGTLTEWHRYTEPPEGETAFELDEYDRTLLRCEVCGHMVSTMRLDDLYSGVYMDATYAGDKLAASYERVMALSPERSDNVARVARVVAAAGVSGRALDVGAGLGVFPARLRDAGWAVTALDPDPRSVAHLREHVGVEAVQDDFMTATLSGSYDLVTFNKVLEHVEDPVAMLARAADLAGLVYIELPDAEGAGADGPGREEFFIEHLHVFSMASLCLLATRAGFSVRSAERLREPSDKYTLVAFLTQGPEANGRSRLQ
jgi:SAM-dependent methyltransferase